MEYVSKLKLFNLHVSFDILELMLFCEFCETLS